MPFLTEDARAVSRPWSLPPGSEPDGWSEFAAWERWMAEHWDGPLPESCESAFDKVDPFDRCYLYALMCDLADGKFSREKPPEP